MGTCKNKYAKIANLRHPRKFKPTKIRACMVSLRSKLQRPSKHFAVKLAQTTKFNSKEATITGIRSKERSPSPDVLGATS